MIAVTALTMIAVTALTAAPTSASKPLSSNPTPARPPLFRQQTPVSQPVRDACSERAAVPFARSKGRALHAPDLKLMLKASATAPTPTVFNVGDDVVGEIGCVCLDLSHARTRILSWHAEGWMEC
eukprot:1037909-Rhodomonas_salina.1